MALKESHRKTLRKLLSLSKKNSFLLSRRMRISGARNNAFWCWDEASSIMQVAQKLSRLTCGATCKPCARRKSNTTYSSVSSEINQNFRWMVFRVKFRSSTRTCEDRISRIENSFSLTFSNSSFPKKNPLSSKFYSKFFEPNCSLTTLESALYESPTFLMRHYHKGKRTH